MCELEGPDGPVVYASDLVPARPWVHLPITMGYDRFPELVVEEKARLLADAVERGPWIAFPHDTGSRCHASDATTEAATTPSERHVRSAVAPAS